MKETKGLLCLAVKWHLVLVLASLLSECTDALMHPFVAVYLETLRGRRGHGLRLSGDDVVDARLV